MSGSPPLPWDQYGEHDLVDMLRHAGTGDEHLFGNAADEIERLQGLVRQGNDEIERLRKLVKESR